MRSRDEIDRLIDRHYGHRNVAGIAALLCEVALDIRDLLQPKAQAAPQPTHGTPCDGRICRNSSDAYPLPDGKHRHRSSDHVEPPGVASATSQLAPQPAPASEGCACIAVERMRQITAEGWTPEHDAEHDTGELARAGACYALSDGMKGIDEGLRQRLWPFDVSWWKPSSRIRNLVKAGALIAAEIDRLSGTQPRCSTVAPASEVETVAWRYTHRTLKRARVHVSILPWCENGLSPYPLSDYLDEPLVLRSAHEAALAQLREDYNAACDQRQRANERARVAEAALAKEQAK